jgi:hypothetical protein
LVPIYGGRVAGPFEVSGGGPDTGRGRRSLPMTMTRTKKFLAKTGIVGGIIAATVGLFPAVADAATVPNRVTVVYSCTYWGTNCYRWYSFQTNGSYNPSAPTYYSYSYVYNRLS